MFKLELRTDDDAIQQYGRYEIAAILREAARRLETANEYEFVLKDRNGNLVGGTTYNDKE